MTGSDSVKDLVEHRGWILVAGRKVHTHFSERRSHFLGRHPPGTAVNDFAAKLGNAHSCESLSGILLDERRYRLEVFTKLALALVDLPHSLNQALALQSQTCKILLRNGL